MPNIKKNIFNKKSLRNKFLGLPLPPQPELVEKLNAIQSWIDFIKSGNIEHQKEISLQDSFLTEFFVKILGYKQNFENPDEWTISREQATAIDGKFADAALGFFGKENEDVQVVIELKNAKTNLDERQHRSGDNRTAIEQAFSYQHKTGSRCKWIIVSNFIEIRLYHQSSSVEYEEFLIEKLRDIDEFRRFYCFLCPANLISKSGSSLIDNLYKSNEEEEQNISKEFYSVYKQLRLNLLSHLKLHNPEKPELLLVEKVQKLLDRIIFVCFCEDNFIMPEKIFRKLYYCTQLSFIESDDKLWIELKGFFNAIDTGSEKHNINKFNGGLFATDYELNNLIIKDDALIEINKITRYDFESDVDVNILGHIFEQSITDIEGIKAGIEGIEFDKKSSKRKKEGIYYTPEYITRYIVENAIGGWLEDRKKELGFYELPDIDIESLKPQKYGKANKNSRPMNGEVQKYIDFWLAYREKLMSIKVLDPACGSGAFLNQAFNYLFAEGQTVNDRLAELRYGQGEIFELDKHILSNNLYGVDLNSESVEITKLSLWIKTANKYSELTALDDNIKCGNSLIDDPAVAGDKAFNWFKEFPKVFPGYRDYKNKPEEQKPTEYEYPTIQEIRERSLQEPSIEYNTSNEDSINEFEVHEPAYSYGPDSKGYEKHGFDVVIGNPPYGSTFNDEEIKYFRSKFKTIIGHTEIYYLFIEKAINNFLKNDAYLSFIVPNQWYSNKYAKELRKLLLLNMKLEHIINLYDNFVFDEANVENSIIITSKKKYFDYTVLISNNLKTFSPINYSKWLSNENFIISSISDITISNIINKMNGLYNKLSELLDISNGFKPYQVGYGINLSGTKLNKDDVDKKIYHSTTRKDDFWKKEIKGKGIHRYSLVWDESYIKWGSWLMSPKERKYFENPKILIRQITGEYFYATIDYDKYYADQTLYVCTSFNDDFQDLKFYLTLINSRLYGFYFRKYYSEEDSLFPKIKVNELKDLPIRDVDKNAKLPFIAAADIMLDKNKELMLIKNAYLEFIKGQFNIAKPSTKLQNWYLLSFEEFTRELEKAKVKLTSTQKFDLKPLFAREQAKLMEIRTIIDETDKKIDSMVYELYELTEDEISIVEEKS
jgi:hypothetical protein